MKTFNSLKIMGITILFGIFSSCGGSGDPGGGGTIFIPDFTATWPVEGDDNYRIGLQYPGALQNEDKPTHSGLIGDCEEEHDTDSERSGNPITGSFDGLDIKFTINRDNGDVIHYEGEMIPVSETNHRIVRIELNSPQEGKLVLAE